MTKHIGYNLAVLGLGILGIVLAVFLVLAILPSPTALGVEVKETVRVSSSPLEGDYLSQLRGYLVNTTNREITVDRLVVQVSNGKDTELVTLTDLKLAPRMPLELSHEWKGDRAYDRILAITVVVDEKSEQIANNTVGLSFDLHALGLLLLLAVDALLLVHFAKQRYYRYQEDRMRAAQS